MVVASPEPEKPQPCDGLPIIDLSGPRSEVSKLIVKACEEYGFFKIINHGVPHSIISAMEEEGRDFFSRPASEKQKAGPATPFGYGRRSIGVNGDFGEMEYILLHTNPSSCVSETWSTVSTNPAKFRCALRSYVEAVKEVAGEVLKLMAEGLRVPDTTLFTTLVTDDESDSLFRLNHYPLDPNSHYNNNDNLLHDHHYVTTTTTTVTATAGTHDVGFGEHSDPQILTILHSNDVPGLQICVDHGRLWLPVSPHPTAFCLNVGDLLQAMTNGRFVSVRHRALTNPYAPRMSMAYFAAPPLHTPIMPLPTTVTPLRPPLYRPFTWADYKRATYSLRLGDDRLDLFRSHTTTTTTTTTTHAIVSPSL